MIWIGLFFIIILVSAVLAFRSMRDYEEFPQSGSLNTLFFVANTQNFSEQSLKKLHQVFSNRRQFFSIERLNKGNERALVIFGPNDLPEILPELKLVEIEDYLADPNALTQSNIDKKITVNEALTWLLEPKISKKILHVGGEIKDLGLSEDQKFYLQIVSIPDEKQVEGFQSTFRVMAVEPDSIEKIALAKKLTHVLETATGLKKLQDDFPQQKKFESFKQRTLIPKEVAPFPLSCEEVYNLIA